MQDDDQTQTEREAAQSKSPIQNEDQVERNNDIDKQNNVRLVQTRQATSNENKADDGLINIYSCLKGCHSYRNVYSDQEQETISSNSDQFRRYNG